MECALHGLLNYGAAFSERCAYVHLFLDECAVVHDGQYQVAVTLVLLNVEEEYLPGELVGGAASGAEGCNGLKGALVVHFKHALGVRCHKYQ